MRREEFMRELEYLLRGFPANEWVDALAFYENYFDEAGAENESQVIQELGSPASVAEKILADVQHTNETNNYQKDLIELSKTIYFLQNKNCDYSDYLNHDTHGYQIYGYNLNELVLNSFLTFLTFKNYEVIVI